MRVHYLHSTNVQIPSANAVQTMHMCESLAGEGADVDLSYPGYLWGNVVPLAACHAYYGVAPRFRLRPLPAPFTPALVTQSAYLPAAKVLAYAVEAARASLGSPARRPDVIYTRCATAALVMPLLGRLMAGVRPLVVFEAHEYPRDRKRARALRHVDAIVAITRVTADELQTRLGFPGERVLVAADGVPETWLSPIDKVEARQRMNLRAERPLAIYTGRVHPDTAPLLFQAAEVLRHRADVVVVGAPPGDPAESAHRLRQLQERARVLGLSMLFLGGVRVEDVRWYQTAADVLLAPYSGTLRWARYASPLKIFEYMAAGRPMVVSDLPVLHEVLRHDENAWFVPAADGSALAAGVMRLLDDPELAARISSTAREHAREYTWTRRAKTIIRFLEDRRQETR